MRALALSLASALLEGCLAEPHDLCPGKPDCPQAARSGASGAGGQTSSAPAEAGAAGQESGGQAGQGGGAGQGDRGDGGTAGASGGGGGGNAHKSCDPGKLTWDELPTLPLDRRGLTAVPLPDGTVALVNAQPRAMRWRPDGSHSMLPEPPGEVPMTPSVAFLPSASGQGQLVLVGGASPGGPTSNSVWQLDLESGVWQPMPPLPAPRVGAVVLVTATSIKVAGGGILTGNPSRQDVEGTADVYDLSLSHLEGGFSPGISLPSARAFASVTRAGPFSFVLGGAARWTTYEDEKTGAFDSLVYDGVTGAWSSAAGLSTPRSNTATTLFCGLVWIAGGDRAPTLLEAYDPLTRKVVGVAALPRRVYQGGIAPCGDALCVWGDKDAGDTPVFRARF